MTELNPRLHPQGQQKQLYAPAHPSRSAGCTLQSFMPAFCPSAFWLQRDVSVTIAWLTQGQHIPPYAFIYLETSLTWQQPTGDWVCGAIAATVFLKGIWGPKGGCAEQSGCFGRNFTEKGNSVGEVRNQRCWGSQQVHPWKMGQGQLTMSCS